MSFFFVATSPITTSAQTPTPSPTPAGGITFIGRTEDSANGANTTVNVSPPAGIQSGDFMLLCVASYNSTPAAPSGFTRLGTPVKNSSSDYMSGFYKLYAAGDGLPYVVGASAYPDAVLRAYRGVSAVDASALAGSSSAATKLALPALAATSANGDEYVGCFANDTRPITLPTDLGHATTQASQWQLGDGDKAIASAGTVPPAETATSSSTGDWIGLAATLKPGAPPSPTPVASPTSTPAPQSGTQAIKANDFLNTLGADSHLVQGQENVSAVTAALQYSGIRNIRDDPTHDSSLYSAFCSIHSATGVLVDELPIVDDDPNNIADTQVEYEALASCGALLEAEGPNEPNNFNFKYQGNTCSASGSFLPCAQYMAAEYAMIKGDAKLAGYPLADLTEPGAEPDNTGLQFLTIPAGQGTSMPAGTKFADVANLHNYVVGNGQTAVADNQAWNAESTPNNGPWDGLQGEYCGTTWAKGYAALPLAQCTLPKVTTETGWPSTTITQDQQGKLITNLYLSAAKLGWLHTFVYLLFDEPSAGSAGWGFFSQSDGTANVQPKALGTYTHNLTAILSDSTSNFTVGLAAYSIPQEPGTVHDLLMQKSNGTYELAVWDDRPVGEATDPVTVNLGAFYSTVNIYDITSGSVPTHTLSNVNSISLSLTDHAFIIEF